ncbi:MAG: DUF5011 domain-containing protein, partial [Candidatus Amulumruptor caecigallinarius]|nr:DUF5011 domain-containing protein [Candidatus Amulumruptor caecigallinarius]
YAPALVNGKAKEDTKVTIVYSEAIELAENSSWTKVNETTIEKTFTGVENEETTINETIKVADKAGNESVETTINFVVDKVQLRIEDTTYLPTLNAEDNVTKEDTKVTITYNKEITLPEGSSWTKVNETTIEKTFNATDDEEKVINEIIKVTDSVENEKETTINFTIDKKDPTVDYELDENLTINNGWYNKPIKVNIIGDDTGTGISYYRYKLNDVNSEWIRIDNVDDPSFTINLDSSNISFVIEAYDKAGNSSTIASKEIYRLDKSNPTLDYTVLTQQSSEDWYNEDININIHSINDSLSGILKLEYSSSKNGTSWSDWEELEISNYTSNLVISEETEGTQYRLQVTDNALNTEIYNIGTYKLDKTYPVIKVDYKNNTYTNGVESTKTFEFTEQADKDDKSLVPTATVTDEDIEVNTNGTLDITTIGKNTIKYTATDAANNVSELIIIVDVIDTTPPVLKLIGDNPQIVKYGQSYVESNIEIDDNLDTGLEATIEEDINVYESGEYIVTYTVTDSHGNTAFVKRIVNVMPKQTTDISSDNSCVSGEDCFIKDGTNNYVWYSGQLWRIIKINDDNTMKLITEDPVSGFSYDDSSSVFADSYANKWLSTEFYNSLNNTNIIVKDDYCIDTLKPVGSNSAEYEAYAKSNIRTSCTNTYSSNVGLLTIDEYNAIGADKSYLNNSTQFFTMTPVVSAAVWVVQMDGTQIPNYPVKATYGIRPVVTISSDVNIVSGNGTSSNPYHFGEDKTANSGDLLNTRSTGEYVKFGTELWRIVKADGSTKLIMDDFYKLPNGSYARLTYDNNGIYSGSNIESYLNNDVYNTIFTDKETNVLVSADWYYSSYNKGEDPLMTTLNNQGNYVTSKIGLISAGELMTGSNSTFNSQTLGYWTLNYANNGNSTYPIYTGKWGAIENYPDRTYKMSIRPAIYIDSSVSIESGNGTVDNPYILNY